MTAFSALSRAQRPTRLAISVRQAGLADLDAMVSIGLKAMPMDPQWNWRFEHRDRFPVDYETNTRDIYRGFLKNLPGNWLVLIAEKPVNGKPRPVAFAVWNVANLLAFLATVVGRLAYTCGTCSPPPCFNL